MVNLNKTNGQLQTMYDRRENLCLSFAKSCTTNPRFIDVFPKTTKKHLMELRNPAEYQFKHANIERLIISAIIHMKHLLHEDADKYPT